MNLLTLSFWRSTKLLSSFLPGQAIGFCLLIASVASHPAQAQSSELRNQLCSSERIVFLGDSITYQGDYVALIDAYLQSHDCGATAATVINAGLPSETVSGLSEVGHANGKFPRPDLMERLDRVLETTKPDFVFACYGMNCGIYQPVSPDRLKAYRDGIEKLRRNLAERSIPLVLMTPVAFDNQVAKAKGNFDYWQYDNTLTAYSEWMVSLREQGQWVIDVHTCFNTRLRERRLDTSDFTFQKDAVHPNSEGHRVIADCVIAWLQLQGVGAAGHRPSGLDDKTSNLFQQKMRVLRDAYLAAAGHQRPGIKNGLPVHQAIDEAKQLQGKINLLFSESEANP